MGPAAGAYCLVPVVLHGLRADLPGQVTDLVGDHHAQVSGILQVRAAPAVPFREQVAGPVRVIVPGKAGARRAGLLAGLPLPGAAAGLLLRRGLPRLVIT